jgi:tetratricopeptide (TPR) repeat protein
MQDDPTKFNRKVLPRWRSVVRTPTAEIAPLVTHRTRPIAIDGTTIESFLNRWRISNDIKDAAEIIDAALLNGKYTIASPAALQVSESPDAMPSLKNAADQILGRASDRPEPPLPQALELQTEQVRLAIRTLKSRLKLFPRDALSNLEIARFQSLLGQTSAAARYVDLSLSLAPNNRYVLRSAVRFWVHSGDKERALEALWRAEALHLDPWLQAAEVAVADICERSPKSLKRKKREIIETPSADESHSELASSLAMLELKAGEPVRRVRKLLRISLHSPTENALAQAVWARKSVGLEFNFGPHLMKMANANEARAWAAYQGGKYEEAVDECWRWLHDEFFSARAAIAGAFVCIALLSRYKEALQFAEHGLRANPDDRVLLNHKLVALAYTGRVTEAFRLLPVIERFESDGEFLPFVHAARGLLAFKIGNFMDGRHHYELAVEAGRGASKRSLSLNAAIYWLEQEVTAGTISPQIVTETVRDFDEMVTKSSQAKDQRVIWAARKKIINHQIEEQRKRTDVLERIGFPDGMIQRISA